MVAPSPIVKIGPSRAGAEYLKVRELASGGMGNVELARALSGVRAGTPVVLKRLHPHLEKEREFVAMLLDEAWITAGLHHPNIVEMYDMGQDASGHFLVLEYVAGDSLLAVIRESKKLQVPIPLELTLLIGAKVAEGLHAAHELRNERGELVHLVHRDVTPSNVLIGMQGEVKLIDFGVAKASERLSHTKTGTLKGKFGYMSPEQARGLAIDRRSDVFSLGVVLWEMLAQRRLHRSESELEMLRMIVEEPAPPIREFREDAPLSLERLLHATLAKNRDDRIGSCGELADFLWEIYAEVRGRAGARELAAFFKRVLPLRCTELAQLLIEVEEFSVQKSVVRPVLHSFTDLPVSAAESEAPVVFGEQDLGARGSLPFSVQITGKPGPSKPAPKFPSNPPGGRAPTPHGPTPSHPSVGGSLASAAAANAPGGMAFATTMAASNFKLPPRLEVVDEEPLPLTRTRTDPPPAAVSEPLAPAGRNTGLIVGVVLGCVGALALGAAAVLGFFSNSAGQGATPQVRVVSTTALPSVSALPSAAASEAPSALATVTASASANELTAAPAASASAPAVASSASASAVPEPSAAPSAEASAAPVPSLAAPSVSPPSAAPTASAAASARGPRTPRPPRAPSAASGITFDDVVRSMLRDPNAVQRPPQ